MSDREAFDILRRYKRNISKDQYRIFKGQIIAGQTDGAMKGLQKVLERNYGKNGKTESGYRQANI